MNRDTKPKKKKNHQEFVPKPILDSSIVDEDEEKFQKYFKDQRKGITSCELTLNKELIEQHQEKIIEQEEWVPAYRLPEDKLVKEEKFIRPVWKKIKDILPMKKRDFNWFTRGKKPGLKGGADSEDRVNHLTKVAIQNAKNHGISLKPGRNIERDGNCSFASVLENINRRSCFPQKLTNSMSFYRTQWVTELQNQTPNFPILTGGYSEDKQKNLWNELKRPGIWNVEYYGDFLIYAVARGSRKNILIFNTHSEAGIQINCVNGNQFNGSIDTDCPVVLGYDGLHYESLHTISDTDIERTKLLVSQYMNGSYTSPSPFMGLRIENVSSNDSSTCFKNGKEIASVCKTSSENTLEKTTVDVPTQVVCSNNNNLKLKESGMGQSGFTFESHSAEITVGIVGDDEYLCPGGCKKSFKRLKSHLFQSKKCQIGLDLKNFAAAWEEMLNQKKKSRLNMSNAANELAKISEQNGEARNRLVSAEHMDSCNVGLEKSEVSELEFIKSIRPKNRSEGEKSRYSELMKKRAKAKDKIRKSTEREKRRSADEESYKASRAQEKKAEREKKRSTDETSYKASRVQEKRAEREKKRSTDEDSYKASQVQEKRAQREKKKNDIAESERRKKFRDSIRDGRKFVCICCERLNFINGVIEFSCSLQDTVEAKHEGIIDRAIGVTDTADDHETQYICFTCKNHILKGKIPPMSRMNELELLDISQYPELQLSELENSMIALNLIFQKVFQLPKSRWPAMKDRTINIPINEADVLNTVKSLPRTPSTSGIVPINLKRKKNFKNVHMAQYISVPKVKAALETLKKLGNRYYQFIPISDNFEEELRENDIEGFHFIYPDDELLSENDMDLDPVIAATDEVFETDNIEEDLDINEKEEREYQEKDPVKKWQFPYNRSTCYTHNYPEIDFKDESERLSIAPGEGKYPSNILNEKDWDLKTFPALLPDGKNSLHTKRKVYLSEQNYFVQRILNKDIRFCTNTAYVFAAVGFIENKQIEGRKGISFKRGKCSEAADGSKIYSLEDPISVLDNVKSTPRYFQQLRYKLLARLENYGPFHGFFTLSCGDMRYPENFTPFLQEYPIYYEVDNCQEHVFIGENKEPLMDFLAKQTSKHDFIKKNLLNATLTFNHRVKMFIKHIVMNKGNPMRIKHYSYKVEFAARGAAHIHGVIWMDWENFKALDSKNTNGERRTMLVGAFEKIKDDAMISADEKEVIKEFTDLYITCSLKDHRTKEIVQEVQIHSHTKACRKHGTKCRFSYPRFPTLQTIISVPVNKLPLTAEERKSKIEESKSVLKKVKNVLENDDIMEEIVAEDREKINTFVELDRTIMYLEEKLCDNSFCTRMNLPERIVSVIKTQTDIDPYKLKTEEDIRCLLMDLEVIKDCIDIKEIEKKRLNKLLMRAEVQGTGEKTSMEVYEDALGVSANGYKVVHKRDVDEVMVNNYNSEWIISWNSNMDLQLCLDYHHVITYISDYFLKDETETMNQIKDALRKGENETLQKKLSIVVNTFLTHRQIGECEAFYRVLPHLNLTFSNIDDVFLSTGFKSNRSSFLTQVTPEEAEQCQNIVQIENKEGLFIEKPSLLDKYERRDTSHNKHLLNLTYLQFAMKYVSCNKKEEDIEMSDLQSKEVKEGDEEWILNDEMDLIVTHNFAANKQRFKLPKFIQLTELKPGESAYMRKRSRMVIRYHKINATKFPHEYCYSQLQMYRPFRRESLLQPNDYEKCKELYDQKSAHNNCSRINNVKSILMKHLDSVEQGTERAQDAKNSEIVGDMMDPAFEQEEEDCALEGIHEHPEFSFLDPSLLSSTENEKKSFRSIDLYEDATLDTLTKKLDADQRMVLDIGVNHAKSVVKARNGKCKFPKQVLMVVQGGAGSGKSMVIDVLSQHMEKILRSSGDHPDHPYIIKCAFTGTAAANIKGQTLHSAFSFSFGNEFFSLSDKARDEKREILKKLEALLLDEYSFIKSDMLYLLDMRLREVKQKPDVPFGGVSIFLFGDLLQLKPVCAPYVHEEPLSPNFQLFFLIENGNLWAKFDKILLRTNHRQGEDAQYADLLNRMRTGNHTEEDIKALEKRVVSLNNPDIPSEALVVASTNEEVNLRNELCLANIPGKEYIIEALNRRSNQQIFKPNIDASGQVKGTPLQNVLKLKIGAKVMLTFNIDTCDSLTNGSFGEVVGFRPHNTQDVRLLKEIIVHFYNEDCGKESRKNHVRLQTEYPGKNVLPITPMEFPYSLSKKISSGQSNCNATAFQFPLRLAFSSTAHKVQGLTVKKPNKLVADLRKIKEPAQAYVMLSRVQAIDQLYILESVCPERITASSSALAELEKMKKSSINMQETAANSIISCNIRSLKKNLPFLLTSPIVKGAEVICLQETWLRAEESVDEELAGLSHHANSVGRGKGISTFYTESYTWVADVTKQLYQMTKIASKELNIINIYR